MTCRSTRTAPRSTGTRTRFSTIFDVAALRFNDPEYLATPVPNGEEPDHPLLEKEYELLRSHLICHSDAEGFYVPQDFTDVLFDDTCGELTAAMVGSSQQLLRELISVAPALGIALEGTQFTDEEAARLAEEIDREVPLWIEKTVWFDLFEAARLSIKHRTLILFS